MSRIVEGMFIPFETRKNMKAKININNIWILRYNAREFQGLMFILTMFDFEKNNDLDYAGAISNQTIILKYKHLSFLGLNNQKVRNLLDRLTSENILKNIATSKYLVNPLYSNHLSSKQSKYFNQITDKEFGTNTK